MNYIFHYDIAAIIVMAATSIYFYMKKNISTVQNRIFRLLLAAALISASVDLVRAYALAYPASASNAVHYLINTVYFVLFNITPVIYFVYILKVVKGNEPIIISSLLFAAVPIVLMELLTVTTPLHGLIFSISEGGEYRRGVFFALVYAVPLYYAVLSEAYVIRYRGAFSLGQIMSVSCYAVFILLLEPVQMRLPNILIAQFSVSISVLLIYFSLENPLNYEEKRLGTYNREAFEKVTLDYIGRGIPFQVLGVEIGGMDYITDMFGVKNSYGMLRQLARVIVEIAQKEQVFYMNGNKFAIVSVKKEKNWDEIVAQLHSRFDEPFSMENVPVTMSAAMCIAAYPDNAMRLADILSILAVGVQEARCNTGVPVVYANDDFLEKAHREAKVVQIMKSALHENRFEVYYQPIYSVEKRRYVSAEALIRLKYDREFISPEEFIPMAERNGLIMEIGEFVFRDVCRFIAEHELLDKGIEYIDVNLSVVQCMQSTLYEHLIEIMDEYKLPYSCINLEITETAAVMSKEMLIENMDRLREYGINFSLDDYGTGFANTAAVIQYPFHTVKLDKSMLWSAMDDKKAMAALKHSIAMLKEMGMKLIAEGVEELKQAQLLEEMGCDFFQGYYYSKPMCSADFLAKIVSMQD